MSRIDAGGHGSYGFPRTDAGIVLDEQTIKEFLASKNIEYTEMTYTNPGLPRNKVIEFYIDGYSVQITKEAKGHIGRLQIIQKNGNDSKLRNRLINDLLLNMNAVEIPYESAEKILNRRYRSRYPPEFL